MNAGTAPPRRPDPFSKIYYLPTLSEHMHIFKTISKSREALLASVIRAKNTTLEKKPADRSNAARPGGSMEDKVPTALCSETANKNCAMSKDRSL